MLTPSLLASCPRRAAAAGPAWGMGTHQAARPQAFLPLLKKAAQDSKEKRLSCNKAAIINISTLLGSIERTPESYFKPVISYRCSKVRRWGLRSWLGVRAGPCQACS